MAFISTATRVLSNIGRRGRPSKPPDNPMGSSPRKPAWYWKVSAVCLGLVVGFVAAEVTLRIAGLPRFHTSHTAPPHQFMFLRDARTDKLLHVNVPSTAITFGYDSNSRGYFGADNSVVHNTNSGGFRGREFDATKHPNTIRIVFFDDPLTFGDGVTGNSRGCHG